MALLSMTVAVSAAVLPVSAQALVQSYQLNVPREPLDMALKDIAHQTGLQIARFSDSPGGGAMVGPVAGQMTADQALTSLLTKSGLTYKKVNDHTIAVMAIGDISESTPLSSLPQTQESEPANSQAAKEGKTSSSSAFRLAQTNAGQTAGTVPVVPAQNASDRSNLEEIIVTAQKREERLQDVPVPVTAVSADALVEQNLLRLQDYYTQIPGLSVTPGDFRGEPNLNIRGITTGGSATNPTVGIVIDDVPYGASTGLAAFGSSPDLDPSDLARIEVLRGPQGTLYGVSSIGGLLKYVTVDPSTDGISARVQAGTSSVYNGSEAGYNASGAVNAPFSDTVAVRASGFARRDPGYIDNLETGQNGANEATVYGGHLSGLWRPSDTFSLKLSALLQASNWDGEPFVDPTLGDLKQSIIPGVGAGKKTTQAYSAVITAKIGVLDFVSLSGFNVNHVVDSFDESYIFGGGVTQPTFGVSGAPYFEDVNTDKFSQEFRLSGPTGEKIEWLVGAFYTHEKSFVNSSVLAENSRTGEIVGSVFSSDDFPTTYEEVAAFADLTVHFTDQFDVQVGGREGRNRQTYQETIIGPGDALFGIGTSPVVNPTESTTDNSFTYLLTPEFKLSPDLMLYARLASGYRPGGPNTTAEVFHLPLHFDPDKTQNWEVGVKGDALDKKLTFDASAYYIDWKNIQLQLIAQCGCALYFGNASRAKSEGVELSSEFRPLKGLNLAAWVAWNEAELTAGFPAGSPAYGVPGDRLPFSPRFSGNFSLQEEFPLTDRLMGFVGGLISYVSNREGVFMSSPPTPPPRQIYPAYANADLRAGAKYGPWTVNLFLNNVADKRALLSGGLGSAVSPLDFTVSQPRTVGLSVVRSF